MDAENQSETGFNPVSDLHGMPPLVVIAMINTCDMDLTKVTFFHTERVMNANTMEQILRRRPNETACLRCFHRRLGTAGDWAKLALMTLMVARIVVTEIDLFENGERCRCKTIP